MIGTSAGAIFATGWAAGYTPEEIKAKVTDRKDGKLIFASFLGTPRRPDPIPELIWKPLANTADGSVKRVIKLFPKVSPERVENRVPSRSPSRSAAPYSTTRRSATG